MHEFDHRAIHAAEAEALRKGDDYEALCTPTQGWVLEEHFDLLPYPDYSSETYTLKCHRTYYQILYKEGDVLDLGDRAFE